MHRMTRTLLLVASVAVAVRGDIHATFATIDSDGDGKLTFDELDAVYDRDDINGDGHLELQEYVEGSSLAMDEAILHFKFYDMDRNGDVTKDEMREMFNMLDINDNKEVTIEEFLPFIMAMRTAWKNM